MQRLQAYKFELIVTGEQQRQMRRFSGACRFVYNKALALQKVRHEQGEKKLSAFELNNLLPQWKAEPETKWLSDSPSQTLQQALKDLDRAYKNFFAKRFSFFRIFSLSRYWFKPRVNAARKPARCVPPSFCGILLVKQRTFS